MFLVQVGALMIYLMNCHCILRKIYLLVWFCLFVINFKFCLLIIFCRAYQNA